MWKELFKQKLPLLGHRNWVLVVDKAFPLQSADGMEIINTGQPLPSVLTQVIKDIKASTHVTPIAYTDTELSFLTDELSPGAMQLKADIFASLEGQEVQTILHDEVFSKLDQASKLFSVLILKTEAIIPYSSVFLQLDCGYWDAEREKALREKMK